MTSQTWRQRWLNPLARLLRGDSPPRRPQRRRTVQLRLEQLEGRITPSVDLVTNAADSGGGSLRAALGAAASGDLILILNNVGTIHLTTGGLTIGTDVVIQAGGGSATIDGGGMFTVFTVNSGVIATLSLLTIQNGGGGVANNGTLTVDDCTITGNTDGGIFNDATLTVNNSTFAGNSAPGSGGGIENEGTLNVTNSTFSGNRANTSNFGDIGGGIANFSGQAALNSVIVAGNFNGASPSTTADDLFGTFTGNDNLIGTGGSGLTTANGNQLNVSMTNVGLAPLGNYGGPTQTFALLPGSFAIRQGFHNSSNDQRGAPRPILKILNSDIGAFQSQGYTLTALNSGQSTTINTGFTQLLTVQLTENFANDPLQGESIVFTAVPAANGASATIIGSPSVTHMNGEAAVLADANGTAGSYNVTASDTAGDTATFALTNTIGAVPPTVDVETDGALVEFVPGMTQPVPLSPQGSVIAASAVLDGSGNTVVFVITTGLEGPQYNETLWKYDPATGWSEQSSGLFQQISAATDASGNPIVFGLLTAGALYEQSYTSVLNAGFTRLSQAGSVLNISAVTSSTGDDTVYAVTTGLAGAQYTNTLWRHSTATGWIQLSSGSFQQVSAGLNLSGQAEVYGVLTNQQLWEETPAIGMPVSLNTDFVQLSGLNGLPAAIFSVAAAGADKAFVVVAGPSGTGNPSTDQLIYENSLATSNTLISQTLSAEQLSATETPSGADEVFATLIDGSFFEYSTLTGFDELLGSGMSVSSSTVR